ncbi:MAG: TetR/AcrR family transcriptional regulator [Acidobacteria bacterium]|nr:TetR/AcrR family transcriptional regulator [Acidobacteriota bacterium]
MAPRSKEANQAVLDRRREQIIRTAFQMFAERGYAATKISDVASAAGLSHGLIYHYFKTKEDVFTELVKSATNVFRAVTRYGSGYDSDPLNKIRVITEMVFSMSHSPESAYYLNIVEQAFISEGISKASKKVIVENITSSIRCIRDLIFEGQKMGQIVREDPQRLALAYYSMVRGITGMQTKLATFPDLPASFSDAEVIVRSLKNPEFKEKPAVAQIKEKRFSSLKIVRKTFVYRTRISQKDGFIFHNEKVTKAGAKGRKAFRIVTEQENGERMVALIHAANLLPIRVEFSIGRAKANHFIDYRDDRVIIQNPQLGIRKELRLSGPYYDNYTVPYILQSYRFESVEKMKLILVMDGILGWPVGPYGIEIRNTGRETVKIPAGEFECHKLELSNPVFEKRKVYYWYPVNGPRFYVKRNILGSVTELMGIQ